MKDPAILLYKDVWLMATKSMRGNAKGWYLNLILYQFDCGDLPNDIEELANLCDVRISEFEGFKQVFEQVLKHKFKQNERGRLENEIAKEILKKREIFKDKRSAAGKMSYVLKYYRHNYKITKAFENWFKTNVIIDFDIKNEQVLKQVFEQNSELYINGNININKDNNKYNIYNKENFVKKINSINDENKILSENELEKFIDYWTEKSSSGKMKYEFEKTWEGLRRLKTWLSNSNKFGTVKQETKILKITPEMYK